ncbi:ABC transporter G family member 15-like [Populus nigra]|uniref:ABC transporter G family member 15-like n=1 Tax=Populus nigra TaxID=3691 RepID=UPI002B26C322|nr:ABC transporter G family member 15-like [Populus nigra]
MCLVWENLTVELPSMITSGSTRKLLSNLSGYAEPGHIMAIMGPSGSGKSTLLDSLAGRLSSNVKMSGKVLINAKRSSIDCGDISYVTQEDFFLGTLTVRETITYSAHLRLPRKMTKEEIDSVVDNTIMEMGLQDCADSKIGNWHLRGISTGEKKRLSISVEILTRPHIMLLDEPTTGLDSASAFFVIRALSNVAYDGKIVIFSIHQPSSDVFNLLDDLLLLSGGETVYFGEAKMAVKFFAEAGFPCPTKRNPSDHFLRCINLDFDIIAEALLRYQNICAIPESSSYSVKMKTAEIRETLIEKYKCSEFSINTRRRIQEISEEPAIEPNKRINARSWKQLSTLTRRSFVNMHRDIGYYWLRMVLYVLISISIGVLFFNSGTDRETILERAKCVCFVYGFMICLSCGGLPFFIEEMKVFRRERLVGDYGEAVLVLSNFFSSFPFLLAISLLSGTIIYYMVKFHPGFPHYAFFCINLFCCLSVIETCMMIVASLVPNVLMGIGIGTGVIVFMMMASEIFRPVPDLPKFFWRYPVSYISFATWAIQGEYKNEMIGLEFDPLLPGNSKVKGETVLQTVFGIPLSHSKWWDLTALLFLLLTHRLVLYMVLKYKDRIASKFPRLHANRTVQHLARRVSKAGEILSSSKRHHPQRPLSSQEGLRSPIP